MPEGSDDLVTLGRVVGVFGVRGWVKVKSYTEPKANILKYSPWYLRRNGDVEVVELAGGQRHGGMVIAQFAGCDQREETARWVGAEIAVRRAQLPSLPAGQHYWSDLVGLQVETLDGVSLGTVDHMLETGANDVLVVRDSQAKTERLIPYVVGAIVMEVDLQRRLIRVDWPADF
ncbi:MAG: ribosome maturation factor RimM [Gammaproteobacteria bacterium SG8_47]|nr:MAG: ribosome maturation factor RimM [Gammaproteobacteria bacterium SG8_47]